MVSYEPKDIDAILADLKRENDRAVAIVGTSMVEYALEEALKSILRPLDKETDAEDLDRMFGGHGIFSGMSSKIVGCYALEIIGRRTRRDLELINKIRNEFAHDMNPLEFTAQNISGRCREIKIIEASIPAARNDYREMFLSAVHMYSSILNLWSMKDRLPENSRAEDFEILEWLAL